MESVLQRMGPAPAAHWLASVQARQSLKVVSPKAGTPLLLSSMSHKRKTKKVVHTTSTTSLFARPMETKAAATSLSRAQLAQMATFISSSARPVTSAGSRARSQSSWASTTRSLSPRVHTTGHPARRPAAALRPQSRPRWCEQRCHERLGGFWLSQPLAGRGRPGELCSFAATAC
jgi:hypothetical protein